MNSHLSEKIKYQIAMRGMSITDFTVKYKIVRTHMDNILYGRSKNPEIILTIAQALGVSMEYLLYQQDEKAKAFIKERDLYKLKECKTFDINLFKEIVIILAEISIKETLVMPQKKFYDYIIEAYNYAEITGLTGIETKAFIEGMVRYSIKSGKLKRKIKD